MISIEILNTYLKSHSKSIFIILIGVIIIGYTGGGLWINKLLSDIEHIETIENQNRASVEERYQLGYAQLFVKIDKLNQYLLEVQELLYDYFSKQETIINEMEKLTMSKLSNEKKDLIILKIRLDLQESLNKIKLLFGKLNLQITQKIEPISKQLSPSAYISTAQRMVILPLPFIVFCVLIIWIIKLKRKIKSIETEKHKKRS